MDIKTPPPPNTAIQIAWRAGTEFFSGILVGLIFGYGIDYLFSTKPWGMIIMILLGAAAGFRNIFKIVLPAQQNVDLSHPTDKGHDHD
jgi:ATP synthase protein I